MKILYGINGTGQGHIIKSLNLINKLKKLNCDVDIAISGTNYQVDIPFTIKYNFHGFSFFYDKKGSIDYTKTFRNLKFLRFIKDIKLDLSSYDRIVTDFEPVTAWASKLNDMECIGVSHQYAFLSDKSPRPNKKSIIGEFILKNMAPVSKPIGLHFEKYDDFILHPVIRGDILKCSASNKGHYSVYLPSYNLSNILDSVTNLSAKFEIFTKEVTKKTKFKNCMIFPTTRVGFFESFITSNGIITSGGFETPSEALYLGKKLMIIPIRGQYEQLCNASSLKKIGVFEGRLKNIPEFLDINKPIKVKWEDPTDKIISEIIN
jgi:uncharacterized protein (TIGR00661 family)